MNWPAFLSRSNASCSRWWTIRVLSRATSGCLLPLLLLSACSDATPAGKRQNRVAAQNGPLIRVLFRSDHWLLLVPYRAKDLPKARLTPDCLEPLLIDAASGVAHPVSRAEALERVRSMQMIGAERGDCAPALAPVREPVRQTPPLRPAPAALR